MEVVGYTDQFLVYRRQEEEEDKKKTWTTVIETTGRI
jgi:hypothetical protein